MIAAFFDLDGTLLAVDSGWLWMERERRLGRLSAAETAQAVLVVSLVRFGLAFMEGVMRRAHGTVEGVPEKAFTAWAREWFAEEVTPAHARRPGWPILDWSAAPARAG